MDKLHLDQHISQQFNADLEELKTQVLELGGLVEQQTVDAVTAIINADGALAEKVSITEEDVDNRELKLDEACTRVLARRQPAASDLRMVLAVARITRDLERMGDLAVNVAERAIQLTQAPPLAPLHDLSKLAEMAEAQLRLALEAFVTKDVEKAEKVIADDDHLDTLYHKMFNDLVVLMMEDAKNIRRATALMFTAKHLERFGDHVTNLAEMVVFMVRGTDVRHPLSREG